MDKVLFTYQLISFCLCVVQLFFSDTFKTKDPAGHGRARFEFNEVFYFHLSFSGLVTHRLSLLFCNNFSCWCCFSVLVRCADDVFVETSCLWIVPIYRKDFLILMHGIDVHSCCRSLFYHISCAIDSYKQLILLLIVHNLWMQILIYRLDEIFI